MKRLLLGLLFLLPLVANAQFCIRRDDYVTSALGQAIPGAVVIYYLQTPGLVQQTVYNSSTCTGGSVSATTDGYGHAIAYLLTPGQYTIVYSGATIQGQTLTDQSIGIAANLASPGPIGSVTPSTGAFTALTAATGLGSQTITNSTIANPELYWTRTDNSPPVNGAGILNGFLAPMSRLDLLSQSGNVTGSQQVLLLNMPNVKGKSYTTSTGTITGGAGAQTVSVGDSSLFSADPATGRNVVAIDFNHSGSSENVTITAVPDVTHITGVFMLNHGSGANLHSLGFPGYKSAFGISLSDQTGSTNDLNGSNPNVTCNAQSAALCNGEEIDITNATGIRPAAYYGEDSTHRYIQGALLLSIGAVSNLLELTSGDGTNGGNVGLVCVSCAKNYGLAVASSGGLHTDVGIGILDSTTAGLRIGANQTAPDNPSWTGHNPTYGAYLTALCSSGSCFSNNVTFEAYDSGTLSTFGAAYSHSGGGLFFTLNNASPTPQANSFMGYDYAYNSPVSFRLRDSSTATVVAEFKNVGNAGFLNPANSHTLGITADTYSTTSNCASAASPAVCGTASAGRVVIAAAATTVTVNTSAVTSASEILLQPDASLGTALSVTCNTTGTLLDAEPWVSTRSAGTSFTITVNAAPSVNPECLSYRIIN